MDRIEALERLRAREAQLRAMGIEQLSLFGSVARGDQSDRSDVDLAVRFGAATRERMGVFEFLDVRDAIAELLGRPVDLVTEPARRPRFSRRSIGIASLSSERERDRLSISSTISMRLIGTSRGDHSKRM
jgi:predicted nucleotidyltransferase